MSYRQPAISTSLAIRAAVVAVLAITVLNVTARPVALANGEPDQAVILGVDVGSAVPLSPEVDAEEKFEAPAKTEAPAALTTKSALMSTSVKAVAPVAKPKPAAPKKAAAVKQAKPAATGAKKAAKPAAKSEGSGGWSSAKVSWYGPGFYGRTMAGGGKLQPGSMVVAHRSLPFGTKIEFSYKGRTCTAVVQDRGPHIAGRVFDLGPGTAKALGFGGVGTVQYRILGR